jgi:phage gp29-like protein
VQLLTAGTVGTDIYERYLSRWDAAISKVIMGQTLTAELSGDTGSFAASKTHMDVAEDIAESDRMIVTQAMNELAWIYMQINAPNTAAPVFEYETPEDLSSRADLDTKLYNIGVEFTAEYIEKTYGIDKTMFNVVPKAQNAAGGMLGFAAPEENSDLIPADGIMDALIKATGLSADELKSVEDTDTLQELLLAAKIDETEISRILESIMIYGFGAGLSK